MEPPFPDDPFTWPMARALGIRRSDLDDAVLDGRVVKLLHGVYVRDDYVSDAADARPEQRGS